MDGRIYLCGKRCWIFLCCTWMKLHVYGEDYDEPFRWMKEKYKEESTDSEL